MRRPTTRIVLGLLVLIAAAFFFHREAREEKPKRLPNPPDVVEAPPTASEPAAVAPDPPKNPLTPPAPRPKPPAPKAVKPFVPPIDRTELGIIRGTVRISGKPPVRKPLRMDAVPDCAALHAGVVLSDDLVVHPQGGVRWAFVYVKSGLNGQPPPPPSTPVVLDQIGCVFAPHVLGVRVGQPLLIRNSDALLHNVHAMTFSNLEFNLAVPAGQETSHRFTKREIMLKAGCDLHPWMTAWIGVLDHPYFAVTGDSGGYAIPNLPPGRYIVEVWHEKYASVSKEIDVNPGDDFPLDFTLAARKS